LLSQGPWAEWPGGAVGPGRSEPAWSGGRAEVESQMSEDLLEIVKKKTLQTTSLSDK